MSVQKRKSPRLEEYDYSLPGAYFVTLCTKEKKCLFSNIVGAIHESPLQKRSVIDKAIGFLKMNSSKNIHNTYKESIWQRSYHDHIIKGEEDYHKIWNYIAENPIKWELDCFYKNRDMAY